MIVQLLIAIEILIGITYYNAVLNVDILLVCQLTDSSWLDGVIHVTWLALHTLMHCTCGCIPIHTCHWGLLLVETHAGIKVVKLHKVLVQIGIVYDPQRCVRDRLIIQFLVTHLKEVRGVVVLCSKAQGAQLV